MSARFPTTVRLSLDELSRHGGETGVHRDGWGVGFVQERDALVVREPEAASDSRWMAFMKHHELRSSAVVAHIRKATQGARSLRNTQPFARELAGRMHLFVHNGMLSRIEEDPRFSANRFQRIGDTDSEHAFCALLERLAPSWRSPEPPALEARLDRVAAFARELRELGPANFVYTDGDAVFAHAHRRKDKDGIVRPPGLHVLCRRCAAAKDGASIGAVTVAPEAEQEVALVASVPLSAERWEPLAEGEIVVLREGRVALRRRP